MLSYSPGPSQSSDEVMTTSSQDSVGSPTSAPSTSLTSTQETASSSPDKLSTGGIIGAVVAIIGFFWLVALALWWLLRKWRASRMETARAGRQDWHPGTHRYEHADADEAPGNRDTAFSDALQPAVHHGYDQSAPGFGDSDKEAVFSHPSSAPTSKLASPLADLLADDSDGSARYRSESPATLVDRPLAPSRPQSLKNTELLALAGTDYSVAVARARSSSVPQPLPTTSTADLHAAFGTELTRTSTNPFRSRLHAAEAARQKTSLVYDDDRDWWAGQRV
ncbi:hypothetical protein V8D89_000962 [Ganoderma adspersum]